MKRIINFFKSNYFLAVELSNDPINRKLLFLKFIYSSICWLFYEKEFSYTFSVNNIKFHFKLSNKFELGTLRDIFLKKEYEFNYLNNPKVIFDLGANIGDTAIFFATKFPSSKVYAVEPNPQVFKRLVENTLDFDNIECFNLAISEKNEHVTFSYGESHLGGSIIQRVGNDKSFTVESKNLKSFCDTNDVKNIDILKFDIEGGEESLFRQMSDFRSFNEIVGEVHPDLIKINYENILEIAKISPIEKKDIEKGRYILFARSLNSST